MNDVLKELTKTKEMALAWSFRGALSLLLSTCGVMLWMAWGQLQEVRSDLKHNAEIQWQAISTLTANQNTAAAASGILNTTLADHIKQEAQVIEDIHSEVRDHETRIRTLESTKGH